jgi:hypothetical protein
LFGACATLVTDVSRTASVDCLEKAFLKQLKVPLLEAYCGAKKTSA